MKPGDRGVGQTHIRPHGGLGWSPGTPTTGPRERGNDTSSGRQTQQPDATCEGRTGDCPGPRKETATRQNVTQGGWNGPNLAQQQCANLRMPWYFFLGLQEMTATDQRPVGNNGHGLCLSCHNLGIFYQICQWCLRIGAMQLHPFSACSRGGGSLVGRCHDYAAFTTDHVPHSLFLVLDGILKSRHIKGQLLVMHL